MATTAVLAHDALVRVLRETEANPWPDIDDRAAWDRVARTEHGAMIRAAALEEAQEFVRTPAVPPTMSEFLLYTRTGDRRTWEARENLYRSRLDAFALAACFEGDAAWVDRAADALWGLCEQTTWVTPAHEGAALPDSDFPNIDLWAAMRAQDLGEMLQLLGPALDRIDGRIRRRALRELDRRVFDPFLARGDWKWLWPGTNGRRLNNWTAVCAGGILLGALAALDHDPERQARIVSKAVWSLGFFRDTFGANGSLDEGAGYWSYGVSYYVMAAERLAARTRGAVDLLADDDWREIAQFPLRVQLYGDTFVNFSDCALHVRPVPGWLAWLGRRLNVPGLSAWAARLASEEKAGYGTRNRHLPFVLRTLFWMDDLVVDSGRPHPGLRPPLSQNWERGLGGEGGTHPSSAFLPDVEWLIARADASDDALILAIKGGHNGENHNHNDGGSFLVHFRREPLIAELGTPTYTRQFFSAARYENLAARSLGHSVPLVNGQEQQAGRSFAARVLAQSGGAVSFDLAGLYGPEANLVALRRDVALHASGAHGFITISDHASFATDNATLALPLITQDCRVEVVEPGQARITGERGRLDVSWNPAQATCRAEEVATDDPKFLDASGQTRVRCLWFDIVVEARQAQLDLTITAE